MSTEPINSDFITAERIAHDIKLQIDLHYVSEGMSESFVKAEVLVPMTENINMTFEIDVPAEMEDEDNTTLLEYFINHIYQPAKNGYMFESVSEMIGRRESDLQALQENLDNFDADAFMSDPDKYLMGLDEKSEEPLDLLDTPIGEASSPWDGYLPDSVDIQTFFTEMAEIYPKYIVEKRPQIKFRVIIGQGGEGVVPHLHMYFRNKEDKNPKYISYVCLHEAEYAPQHKDGKQLNSSEKKALIEFLNTFRKGAWTSDKDGNPIPCNCWQECVDVWTATYGDEAKLFKRDKDGIVVMPDYSEL